MEGWPLSPPPTPGRRNSPLDWLSLRRPGGADRAGSFASAVPPDRRRFLPPPTHTHAHTVPSSQARPRRPLCLRQRLGVARVPGSTAASPPALAPQPPPATPGRKQRALGTSRHQPPRTAGRRFARPAQRLRAARVAQSLRAARVAVPRRTAPGLRPPAGYLVDPASIICLSQRLSHASLSAHGRYSETANGSLNQLWSL